MKVIKGNNNIVLVENIDGSIAQEIELDDKTSVITNSDKTNTFNSKDELRTYIASVAVDKFPTIPNIGEKCEYNKVYKYESNKVKCVQEHTRMAFTPEETPNLWLIIPTITSGYPDWKQPTGAHDAYKIGDRVNYKGSTWESKINANVTVPDGDTPYNRYWKTVK